ncbi:TIGR00730 family Rossman fold protein [Fodinicola feengrottensis]|uniref:Cytokinin riboside 5'-monophosphate phosphoribohydrolase n=1 Tax=Fodinicola feengrottensis TaxID=435914 RepID=A0ABN2FQQ3_9ACTN
MRLCVFCGSQSGRGDGYVSAARDLGRQLAERGIGVVYGGASVGTMGQVADAALAAGGTVIGVIPNNLFGQELTHQGLTELHFVEDMHQRKAKMAALADGFIALPGGAGTLEELFEVWTWAQIGVHAKPVALLDVAGYYQPLRTFLDQMVTEQFLRQPHRDMLFIESDLGAVLDRFGAYEPPAVKPIAR